MSSPLDSVIQALAMAQPTEGGQGPGITTVLIQVGLIFLVFWFVLIAPMRRKQKKHQEMLGALRPGDKVVTNGGIYGTVTAVGDRTLHIKIADQVKIEVARSAVAGLQGDPEAEAGAGAGK